MQNKDTKPKISEDKLAEIRKTEGATDLIRQGLLYVTQCYQCNAIIFLSDYGDRTPQLCANCLLRGWDVDATKMGEVL